MRVECNTNDEFGTPLGLNRIILLNLNEVTPGTHVLPERVRHAIQTMSLAPPWV